MLDKLDFQSCNYADDFECLIDVHNIIPSIPEERFDLWLRAYDTSCCETKHEEELYDSGYNYECCCCVQEQDNGYIVKGITPRAARNEDNAKSTLIEMAKSMMDDENLIKHLHNSIDSCITVIDF